MEREDDQIVEMGDGAAVELELAQLAEQGPPPEAPADLSLVLDVPVELAVEIGRARMTIREALAVAPGSIIVLDRAAGEPADLLVNGRRVARGEVVAIDEELALRVTEVVGPERGAGA
jgi:flagellar motor switch protein FliN/FliY